MPRVWSAVAKVFHWLMVPLILAQIALGIAADNWPLSPAKLNLFVWHKSIGMSLFLLVALRLLWRWSHPVPALPPETPAWERHAARASHFLLYAAMIGLPLSGWVISSASGIPFRIFWQLPLPSIAAVDERNAELAAFVHGSLFVVLATVLIVHVGAALRHHYIKRDGVLRGMLFSGRGAK